MIKQCPDSFPSSVDPIALPDTSPTAENPFHAKGSLTKHIVGNYGSDPFGWSLNFSILGWTITSYDSQISTMLTDEQAKVIIRMIKATLHLHPMRLENT